MSVLQLVLLAGSLSLTTSVRLVRRELSSYPLARCNDGSTAAYYHDQVKGSFELKISNLLCLRYGTGSPCSMAASVP